MTREDLTGRVFERLTVLRWHHVNDVWQHFWECQCICGNITIVHGSKLRRGHTKSCGCWQKELRTTHGHAGGGDKRTPEYTAWHNMIQRCYNSKNTNYKRYGAKGVIVHDRWRYSFENFLEDMGLRPSSRHSLERKKNKGDYSPDNCIWETKANQDRNKSTNVYLTYNGITKVLLDWSYELKVKYPSIRYHLKNGKSFDWIYNHYKTTRP